MKCLSLTEINNNKIRSFRNNICSESNYKVKSCHNDNNNNNNPNKRLKITINPFTKLINKLPNNYFYDDNEDNDDDDDDNYYNDDDDDQFLLNHNKNKKCANPLCDHLLHEDEWLELNKVEVEKIDKISDLINLGNYYHCKMRQTFNEINLEILFNLQSCLRELENMIGLTKIKDEIINLIIYLLLFQNTTKINDDMLNIVVTGNPGCGKTTFIEILAKIFKNIGILKKGHIVKAKRADLVAAYLGQTAIKTQKKIDEATDGILLIDEAYSLGNPEKRDMYSKECLDTLNQNLSERKSNFICIIAGYKNALTDSFFSQNEGLRRRFPFHFDIEKYNYSELSLILLKKINEYNYFEIVFTKTELDKLIKDSYNYYVNSGGDMETLFTLIKIVQNKRIFLMPSEHKKKLLFIDINSAIINFLKGKKELHERWTPPPGMYI